MTYTNAWCAFLAFLTLAGEAHAGDSPMISCKFTVPMERVERLTSLPEIASELDRQKLVIADAGEPYQSTDVVHTDGVPTRQFIVAYRSKDSVVLWYRSGGFSKSEHAILFERKYSSGIPSRFYLAGGTNLHGPRCEVTNALIEGVRTHGGVY